MSSSHPNVFVGTKIGALRPPRDLIARSRLEAARTAAAHVRLVTITAPGGFGKSTLAAAWSAQWQAEGYPCAWLTLEKDDDEPSRFLFGLAQALQRLGHGVGQGTLALLQGSPLAEPRVAVSMLINELDRLQGEAFLVLDDYQWVRDAAIHDAVAFLVSHAPPQFHLLIASRLEPPLPLARLRAHGEWLDVDALALRFDEDETSRFLQSACAQPLTRTQVAQLHAVTEGWAAALRIAALGPAATSALQPGVTGASRAFAYLIEDLLESLPESTVRFMSQTAVLERLNPELCDAVTGQGDAARHLGQLLQSNLLVEPMEADGWLRFHQLLRDYLSGPLSRRLGTDTVPLYRRAAQWFAGRLAWTDAVKHALAAGDTRQAIEWLAHCGMGLVKTGDLMTLLGWRRQFPPELLSSQPQVQLAVAWGLTLAMRFKDAEPLLDEIERTSNGARPPGSAASDALTQCLAVRAVAVALQDDSPGAAVLAAAWRERGSLGGAWTFNVMSNVMRYVHWKAENWVGVYEQPWEPYTLEEERQNAFSTVYREVLLGCIELHKARLGLAERHAREALRHAELHAGVQSVSAALAAPLMAMLHYEQGRIEPAAALLQPLLSLIDNAAMIESVMQAYLVLVRIARAQGEYERAFELLQHAEAIAYNRGWDRMVAAMLRERLRLLVAEGRLDEGKATLVRLNRIAAAAGPAPQCSRSDLLVFRDWGHARLAMADQRIGEARVSLQGLLAQAHAAHNDFRAIQLGTCLVLAHMADGDQEAAFSLLRDVLQAAQRSGVIRCVLDEGSDVEALLARFLVSAHCDAPLADCVRRFLASSPRDEDAAASYGPAGTLTERERRVLMLVAAGQSNKEVARQMNISAETVKTHLKSVFTKLGVQQRRQAVILGRSLGLIPERPEP